MTANVLGSSVRHLILQVFEQPFILITRLLFLPTNFTTFLRPRDAQPESSVVDLQSTLRLADRQGRSFRFATIAPELARVFEHDRAPRNPSRNQQKMVSFH
jgi:hypothetical protein